MNNRFGLLVTALSICLGSATAAGQIATDYEALVQQGRTQLQAGNNDAALASANSAIKLNAERWEAYAVAGGALMNLKRYENATDQFGHAIDKAPEAKQDALRDLRKQCLLAEAETPSGPGATPTPSGSISVSGSPSYADTVRWIQEHIKEAGVQGTETRDNNGVTTVFDDQRFSFKVNGCTSMDLMMVHHWRMTDPHPPSGDDPVTEYWRTADYTIPFSAPAGESPEPIVNSGHHSGVMVSSDVHIPTEVDYTVSPARTVLIIWSGDLVHLSWITKGTNTSDNDSHSDVLIPDGEPGFEVPNAVTLTTPGEKGVRIFYGMPGTQDDAIHMMKALQHLITLCRQTPNATPKDIF